MKNLLKKLRKYWQKEQNLPDIQVTALSNAPAISDMTGDQSSIHKSEKKKSKLSSIAQFKLTDFINACITNGEGLDEENWINILCEYSDILEDESSKRIIEIRIRMMVLKLRAEIITLLLNCAGLIGSECCDFIIVKIKEFDEEFCQFQFSSESYISDLEGILSIEINNDIEYQELKKELEFLSKSSTTERKEVKFYDDVSNYNETFKTSFSIPNLTTMEYAVMMKRLTNYYKYIKENG